MMPKFFDRTNPSNAFAKSKYFSVTVTPDYAVKSLAERRVVGENGTFEDLLRSSLSRD